MATVKKGTHVAAPQWWKHLRDWKRVFWKRERNATARDINEIISEMPVDRQARIKQRADELLEECRKQ